MEIVISIQVSTKVPVVTYDSDFKKFSGLTVVTPGEVVQGVRA
jgi:hypothetical protein